MPTTPKKTQDRPVPIPAGVRLQKALADAGIGARRDCEQLIFDGHVRVNGKVVRTLPEFIDTARDFVEVRGEPVRFGTPKEPDPRAKNLPPSVYVLVHKPKGTIATTRDTRGRRGLLEFVPRSLLNAGHLYPVGQIDNDASGLVLLTNDNELEKRLSHPKSGIVNEYRVTVAGLAEGEHLQKLRAGTYLITPDAEGVKTAKRAAMQSVKVLKRLVDRSRGDRTLLSILLREVESREIHRMFARVGLKARIIERVAIGPLRNRGLKPGEAKLLSKREVQTLRDALLGERKGTD